MVEFAFVAMVLVLMLGGSFDYGMAYRVGLATNEAARTAARTGSALGSAPQADYYALSGAKAALQASGRLNGVQKVVVYKSSTVDGNVPSGCLGASTAELCNVLTGNQFRTMTAASFDATTGCFSAASIKNWCPSSRNNVQLNADYYGVWIQTKYDKLFRMLGTSTLLNRNAVMRLEPDVS